MLLTRFQIHRTSGSGVEDTESYFTLYGHDGHFNNLSFPFPKGAPHEIWL